MKYEIKRFEAKLESRLLKIFNKEFDEENKISEETAIKLEPCVVVHRTHIFMVLALTQEAKRFISRYKNHYAVNIPKLLTRKIKIEGEINQNQYDGKYIKKTYTRSDFSTDYMEFITAVFKAFRISKKQNYFTIQTGEYDEPAYFKNKHFKIIIAPQINPDEIDF